jgi:multidrug transporter EmrE-like cation transporter
MDMAGGLSLGTAGMFLVALIFQVLGAALLPKTQGFTNVAWTAGSLSAYCFSLWPVAQLIRQGVGLAAIVPLMSAAVPLASILIAYFAYGETGSPTKLAMLILSCAIISVASALR